MAAPDVEGGLRPLSGLTFDVTVEIPKGQKNKYEVDHETGRIRLDRTRPVATTRCCVYRRPIRDVTTSGICPTYASSRCSRSSISFLSTRISSPESRSRVPPGPALTKPKTRFERASSGPRSTASTVTDAS